MKIRLISDIHLDVNESFPFSYKDDDKDIFTLIAGDTSGHPSLTKRWIKQNIKHGMLIAGNHVCYNDKHYTIRRNKQILANEFTPNSDVTFLDEMTGVMAKEIPGTNILVIGSTLYTDYQYANEYMQNIVRSNVKRCEHLDLIEKIPTVEELNMSEGARHMNDFRYGFIDEAGTDKMRRITPVDYKNWFDVTYAKMIELVESNPTKDIIMMSHHCPSPLCISDNYVRSTMNASYCSDLEKFILDHPNIKVWLCGHVHHQALFTIGDNNQQIVLNPRGYEQSFEAENWKPNLILDTDTWHIAPEKYENEKLDKARKSFRERFLRYAAFFV